MRRKTPTQDRAEATVDFIEEAAIQLLDVDENPYFTTNHIAERAGVSIGTLYRYFPDKEEILRLAVRREMRRASDRVLHVIETSEVTDAQAFLDEALEPTVNAFSQRAKATHTIRKMVQKDHGLVAEVTRLRLSVARRLHARLTELDPSQFPSLSDAELEAACEAFKAAIRTLERRSESRTIDRATRSRLVAALFSAFSDG